MHTADAVLARAATIPGWLTDAQARLLWSETVRLGRGAHVVEIGSHQGRSTVVIAGALATLPGARLTAVDAFVPGPRYGGLDAREALEANLCAAGTRAVVTIVTGRSQLVRQAWVSSIDLLWIDGKHDYWTCSDDLRWATHLPPDGRVLVHDAFSSIGVTLSLLVHVLPTSRLRYVDRVGSLAVLEVGAPSLADRGRIVAQLPWWLRNVVVKVFLRLRLRPLARALGHHDAADPY